MKDLLSRIHKLFAKRGKEVPIDILSLVLDPDYAANKATDRRIEKFLANDPKLKELLK